jgi:(E)-4-hydroxy-3-methyl-but-2-enyl pyrophosphate reductase
MEIVLAHCMGFCEGVERAIALVEKALKEGPYPIFTLGHIIHNPTVVKDLESKGVRVATSPREVREGTLVLRSHGTTTAEMAEIPRAVCVIDATCPWVKAAQSKAKAFTRKGIVVLLVGERDHPEVKAILSHAGENAFCVRDSTGVSGLLNELIGKDVAVLAQTTSREDEVKKVIRELELKGISVNSANTICAATGERQAAARELARETDLVLVIGGKHSANTRQLLRIVLNEGTEAYLVESAEDVSPCWLRGKRKVGITAGASTPDRVIKEVVGRVEDLEKTNIEPEKREETPDTQLESEVTQDAPDVNTPDDSSADMADAQQEDAPEEAIEEPSEEEKSQADIARELYNESFKAFQEGQIISGRVVSVDDKGILVDVGAKSEGLVPASEFQRKGPFAVEEPSVGDEIMVYVVSSDAGEGGLRLSKRRADEEIAWRKLEESYRESNIVEASVVQQVKGGLVVDIGLRGFVPASQVERGYVNDLSQYVGKTLRLRVLELDRSKNRVVLSQRVVLEEEHEKLCQETWDSLEEGQVRKGVVKGITDFGVFVDLGGVDGLLHISELSWGRVKHPSEVVEEGQEIEVKVLRLDREKGKISLGRKQVLPDPWGGVEEKYPVGSVIPGEVTRTAPFGAFVQLEPGVEGLVHISEMADRHIAKAEEVVNSGDKVSVRVLRVSESERRISLSIRQADQEEPLNEPETPTEESYQE